MSRTDALQISPGKSGPALTAPQKRFNTLIRQIELARQALAAWRDNAGAYRQAYVEVLEPLRAELLAGERQWVFALDAALDQRGWSQPQRRTLSELVCEAAGQLLAASDDDAQIKALFDKHAEVDFDTLQRDRLVAMKDLAEAMTGLDLGEDEEIATEDELRARLRQGLEDQAQQLEARRPAKPAPRRKSAAQQRREAEAQQATQSLREIYRKLASTLHPDRETDERQREEKTALMQRVNQAYAAQDLLALLELQLQIEQIDANRIAQASEQRLKHYNKVLAGQLDELKAEIERVETAFRMQFGIGPFGPLDPRKLGRLIEQTRRSWRAELTRQQRDLRMLGDVEATRRWLKAEVRRRAAGRSPLDFF